MQHLLLSMGLLTFVAAILVGMSAVYLPRWGVVEVNPAALKAKVMSVLTPDLHPHVENAWDLLGGTCGWLDSSEFVILSSHVVTPQGEMAAAGGIQPWMNSVCLAVAYCAPLADFHLNNVLLPEHG